MIEILKRPYLINWSGNNIYYELYSADAEADSSITFEVTVVFKRNNETDFREIITLPYVPVDGSALFDIKDIIDAQLSFDMPEFADESMICYNQSGQFYIEFREITADNPDGAFDATESEQPRYAAKGGIHPYHNKGNNFWLTYFPTEQKFFTWKPEGQLLLPNEQSWLGFFYDGDETEVLAEMELTYRDGSTETFTREIPVAAYCFILLQSSLYYDWDGGAGFDADEVYRWKVRIRDAADTETLVNWYMYELDNRQDYNDTIIHYRNSLGGLDHCRVRGVIEKKLSYELQQAEHVLPVDYFNETTLPPQQSTTSSSENVIQSGEVGFVTKDEQESLRDVFLYRQLHMKKLGKWWPLVLLTDGFTLKRSTDMRWSVPLEWKVALTAVTHYNDEDADFGEGVNSSNVCLATLIVTRAEDPIEVGPSQFVLQCGATVDENPQGITIDEWEFSTSDNPGVWTRIDITALANVPVIPGTDAFLYFRAVAPDGSTGPIFTLFFNEYTVIPAPGAGNSEIIVPYSTSLEIFRESVLIYAGVADGSGTPLEFDCLDGSGIDIEVRFGSIRPKRATLESGGNTYTYVRNILFITRIITFNNINASAGIIITIP